LKEEGHIRRAFSLITKQQPLNIYWLQFSYKLAVTNMEDSLQDKIAKQRKFEESLSEAIDEALTSLGEPVKNTLYLQLEHNFNVQRSEIPNHIKEFSDFLSKVFGLGAAHLETKCMENLHSRINVKILLTNGKCSMEKWLTEGMTFENYVSCARNNYCNPL
jgi:hypothetical protein